MKRGPHQVFLAADEFLNAVFWGDARHTLSGRTGQALARGKAWAKVVVVLIDGIFGAGHCTAQAKVEGLL